MGKITVERVQKAVEANDGIKLVNCGWYYTDGSKVCEACALTQIALAEGIYEYNDLVTYGNGGVYPMGKIAEMLEVDRTYLEGFVNGFDFQLSETEGIITPENVVLLGKGWMNEREATLYVEGIIDGRAARQHFNPDRATEFDPDDDPVYEDDGVEEEDASFDDTDDFPLYIPEDDDNEGEGDGI